MVPSFFSDSSTSSGRTTFDDNPILCLRLLQPQITNHRNAPRPPKFSNPSCFGPAGETSLSSGTLAGDLGRSQATEARVRCLPLVTGEGRGEEHALRTSTNCKNDETTLDPPSLLTLNCGNDKTAPPHLPFAPRRRRLPCPSPAIAGAPPLRSRGRCRWRLLLRRAEGTRPRCPQPTRPPPRTWSSGAP
jgi:hypothetical protein